MSELDSDLAPDRSAGARTGPDRASARGWPMAVVAAAGAVGVLIIALIVGGGEPQAAAPGLGDPGPITGWGLPISKLAMNLAGAVTVGCLLFGVISPSKRDALGPAATRAVRTAAIAAWLWAVAAAATLAFTLSDFLGTPPHQTDYQGSLSMFVSQISQGRALAVVVLLTVVVAAVARNAHTLNSAALVLVLAVAAILPPPLTGHSATAANHDLATSSLLVHVVAVTLWVGGLIALTFFGRKRREGKKGQEGKDGGDGLPIAASRFSSLALWCFVAAGLSGLLNAWLNLGAVSELWESRYGWLVIGKAVALAGLGWFGYTHRKRTLPALDQGTPGAFRRFALGEAAVMAGTFGLAVGLSRAARPVSQDIETDSVAEALIGFPVPPISAENLVTMWRVDSIVLLIALLAIVGYSAGLLRLRAQQIPWPVGRTIAWFAGVAVGIFVLTSGVATYAPALFSVHMVQHMTLTMLVPILLAMAAPITLALRALPAQAAEPGARTARDWILVLLHSRVMRVLTHPVVALTLYIVTLYAFYFSPLFAWAMSTHVAHLLMIAHFVLVGSLYFWPIIALDPMPRKLHPAGRMLLLLGSMPFHAFFGVIVMMTPTVIGAEWYSRLRLPWVDPLADQNFGGGFAWATAELPSLIVLGVVFVAWYRSEDRAGKRADRHGEAEWEAYNAQLARLSAHDNQRH